jgi:guanylate kinase
MKDRRQSKIMILDHDDATRDLLVGYISNNLEGAKTTGSDDLMEALDLLADRGDLPETSYDVLMLAEPLQSRHDTLSEDGLVRAAGVIKYLQIRHPKLAIIVLSVLAGWDDTEKLLGMGIDALIGKPMGHDEIFASLENAYGRESGRINFLVAPSGSGKTTLIKRLRRHGFRTLSKVTTRPYRSTEEKKDGELVSISEKEFRLFHEQGLILGAHKYRNRFYGILSSEMNSAIESGKTYICPTTHFSSAYSMTQQFPFLSRLILMAPPIDLAGFGLEKRRDELLTPPGQFDSLEQEVEYYSRLSAVKKDTDRRLLRAVVEARQFRQNIPYADHVLRSTDIDERQREVLRYFLGENASEVW